MTLVAVLALTASTSNAFWGWMPWGSNGYNNAYYRGHGAGAGYMGGEQYRGGEGASGADFSMSLSGGINTGMRGYGSGYGATDSGSRGYDYGAPYYGGYGMPPYGFGTMPMQPLSEAR